MDRRHFLRGTGLGLGAVYFAPFLRSLEANDRDSAMKPARVLFFVQGNGIYPAEIQPETIEREKKSSKLVDCSLEEHELRFSLEPLAPWKRKLTMIHGLAGKIARGSHNSGFAALGCWPMGKKAYGETVDVAMAKRLGGIYPNIGLGVSNRSSAMTYNLSSAGRGKALPTLLNPVIAHKQFFAAGLSGAARGEFEVETNLLDFLAGDVKRITRELDGSEREKLEKYLEAFEAMGDRQGELAKLSKQIAKATPEIDPKHGVIQSSRTEATGVFDRLEAQFDVAAGVMIAGLTNVVTMSAGAGPDRIGLSCMASELGVSGGYVGAHGIGHGGGPHGRGSSEWHALIRRKCVEKLARFIAKLESIPEGDGTMMDNTLVVYLSDSAEGHHPLCTEWPFILIGDLGGRLKTGNRYLSYPWYGQTGHRTTANLYLSLLHALGDRRDTFGVADFGLADLDQTGPLAEIMA